MATRTTSKSWLMSLFKRTRASRRERRNKKYGDVISTSVNKGQATLGAGPKMTVGERLAGQVQCPHDGCSKIMDPRSVNGHLRIAHNVGKNEEAPKPTPKQPRGGRPQSQQKTDDKSQIKKNPPPKRTPSRQEQQRRHGQGGRKMGFTKPIENASTNPGQGVAEELAQVMNRWAGLLPANFRASRREAESMGEGFRGVADALRRRSQNMVEMLNIAPSAVEPYEDAAKLASQMADTFMEVANRIEALYKKEIEMVNSPKTPNLEYLNEDGDGSR